MAIYSKFLSLINGSQRTVDLSTNTLSAQGLQLNAATGGGNITQLAHASTTSYTISWPAAQAASSGYVLSNDGTGNLSWVSGSAGSVTSVALSDGSTSPIYTISGSPVTSSGTLTFTLSTQTANKVFAGPTSGGAAQPTFRTLVSADIPSLAYANQSLSNLTGFTANQVIYASSGSALTSSSGFTYTGDTGQLTVTGQTSFGVLKVIGNGTDVESSISFKSSNITDGDSGQWAVGVNVSGPATGFFSVWNANITATSPIVIDPSDNNVGINNNTPAFNLDVGGTLNASTSMQSPELILEGSTSGTITQEANDTTTDYTVKWPAAQASGTKVLQNDGSGNLSWASSSTGTVTSVAFSDASTTPIYTISGSPVTTSGTLTQTLTTQAANIVFAGPTTGSAAQPTFRSLVSADIPDLSATYVTQSEVGASNGVASLDSGGHIPLSQLPSSLVEYQGTWDASTNTPTLSNTLGIYNVSGYFFIVSTGGTVDFGAGNITFNAGDWVLFNGTIWERAVQSNVVQSVNGQTGVVTINAINQLTGDVTATAASGSQSKATTVAAIQGTSVSGTTGSGNVVFSASPTLTGTITAAAANFSGAISASNFSGSSSGTNTGDQTITLTGDVTGSGTGSFATTIAAGAVTATKLGTVTDGTTLDQSGAGSTLEIKTGGVGTTQLASNAVTSAKIATSAFDGVTITGGGGSAATVVYAPAVEFVGVAGQDFTSTNTTYAVRWGLTANSETAGRLYACDTTTSSFDLFYAIGTITVGGSTAATGSNVTVTRIGSVTLGSSDPSLTLVGQPVFLDAGGALTQTAPSSAGTAVTRMGMLRTTTIVDVNPAPVAIN